MAIIGIFLGGVGLALVRGGDAASMRSGHRTLVTMVNAARGQAALKQTESRLLIHADAENPDRFLRFFAIQVRTFDQYGNPGAWRSINDGNYLPRGIYVVPPRNLDPAPPAGTMPVSDSEWPYAWRTILPDDPNRPGWVNTVRTDYFTDTDETYLVIYFDNRGWTQAQVNGEGARLVIAPADRVPGSIIAFDPEKQGQARGGMLRGLGSMAVVNDPDGFPELN